MGRPKLSIEEKRERERLRKAKQRLNPETRQRENQKRRERYNSRTPTPAPSLVENGDPGPSTSSNVRLNLNVKHLHLLKNFTCLRFDKELQLKLLGRETTGRLTVLEKTKMRHVENVTETRYSRADIDLFGPDFSKVF
ncbi:uncharacterized protein EV154DRAFT_485020 [Mucor mucedo]|uniref:uncharacterized protein n=1 Tax=Mucor mucedo TaxID=29922 RepID=UPI0022203F17|nr:uncharacterized protein EV154DRAFT_485020 [Mucor mucedo]KAI7887054.1 hypothetical protein EV154DRAFT_485020 [Mucor mucedo]